MAFAPPSATGQKLFSVPTNLVPPRPPINSVALNQQSSYHPLIGGLITSADMSREVIPDNINIQETNLEFTVAVLPQPLFPAPSITGVVAVFADTANFFGSPQILAGTFFQIPNVSSVVNSFTFRTKTLGATSFPAGFRYNTADTPTNDVYYIYIQAGSSGLANQLMFASSPNINPVNFPSGQFVTGSISGATGTVALLNGTTGIYVNNMGNGVFVTGDVITGAGGPAQAVTMTSFVDAIRPVTANSLVLVSGSGSSIPSFS